MFFCMMGMFRENIKNKKVGKRKREVPSILSQVLVVISGKGGCDSIIICILP